MWGQACIFAGGVRHILQYEIWVRQMIAGDTLSLVRTVAKQHMFATGAGTEQHKQVCEVKVGQADVRCPLVSPSSGTALFMEGEGQVCIFAAGVMHI